MAAECSTLTKNNENTVYMDIRKEKFDIYGKHVNVDPDVVGDFRNIPFDDERFSLVIFDPPHLIRAGPNSIMKAQYGQLNKDTWKADSKLGFYECMRVLKRGGDIDFQMERMSNIFERNT